MNPVPKELKSVLPIGSSVTASGSLAVGGCDLLDLAKEYGTPSYVVAEDDIRHRAAAYVKAFSKLHPNSDVLFASKAFPCPAVYGVLADEGLSCDVASAGELHLALKGGFDPTRVFMHGNAKTDDEIKYAAKLGVGYIVIDSLDEIKRLEQFAPAGQKVLIRVTPGIKPSTHSYISTGQLDSKFGFSFQDAKTAIKQLNTSSLDLVGIHIHIGSQIFELEPYAKAIKQIAELGDFEVYNLGGGLGVAYSGDDLPPSFDEYVKTKVDAVHAYLGKDKRILIEPGRSLVANSTVTLYSVVAVKDNVSHYVAVDGGMSDNLRPMLYNAEYQAQIVDRLGSDGESYKLVGKHCESGDLLVEAAKLNAPQVGDTIVTPATGAYCYSMANNYNGALRPPVIFCKDGDAKVVVRRETFEDLVLRDVS